jgi:endonuclease/exonuclease/phosphatase family metal-dependent hydrolase
MPKNRFRVVFYNVENLFDPENDPVTSDEEFTPTGTRGWSYYRYHQKIYRIRKILSALGEWSWPDVIGLAEIENRKALEDLFINNAVLREEGYRIIHQDSHDRRGIDVALVYREKRFEPISTSFLEVIDHQDTTFKTRQILHVQGIISGKDTIHFFVNHWPSRYGGLLETRHKRKLAALTLRKKVDEIQKNEPGATILIMGDLNDEPNDESILLHLGAGKPDDNGDLINLMNSTTLNAAGTIVHDEGMLQWNIFDHLIVSKSLMISKRALNVVGNQAYIFNPDWLYDPELKKPFRTYTGFKYSGGFSDHFPVYLDLEINH